MKVWVHFCLAVGLLWAGCSKFTEEKSKEQGNSPAPSATNAAPELPPEKQHVVRLVSAKDQTGFLKHPVLAMYEFKNVAATLRIAFKADPFSQPNPTEALPRLFDYCTLTLNFPARADEGMVTDARLGGFLRQLGQSQDLANFRALKLSLANHRPGRLGGKIEGTIIALSERPKGEIGAVADANDSREKLHQVNIPFLVEFDLTIPGKTAPLTPVTTTNTPPQKLSPQAIAAALGAQVGRWDVKVRTKPAAGEPGTFAFKLDISWKEEGKSIKTAFTVYQDGKPLKFTGQKYFDTVRGIFINQQKAEGMPEMISHEQYDPAKRIFHGTTVAPPLPPGIRISYTFQLIGKDECVFKSQTLKDSQVVQTEEHTHTRRSPHKTTKPKTP